MRVQITRRQATQIPRASLITFFFSCLVFLILFIRLNYALYPYLFGFYFGYIMQRSRFCFASAFRDIFLIRNTALTRAVILAIAISTLGFAGVHFMHSGIDLTFAGRIYPVGLHTFAGGLLFGFGMVIAGACVSGCLVRMGEGYVMQYVTFAGLLSGAVLGAWHLDWWMHVSIYDSPTVFLPVQLGWAFALLLQFSLLILLYLWAMRIEGTRDYFSVFKKQSSAMPYGRAAVFLALGNILLVLFYGRPWGIMSGIAHLGGWLWTNLGFPVRFWEYFHSDFWLSESEGALLYHPLLYLVIAMILGSLSASLANREFRWRFPRNNRYYLAALVGGLCMGYGSKLAIGCNIGALFSGISSLSLHGWCFALALLLGAYAGGRGLIRFLLSA